MKRAPTRRAAVPWTVRTVTRETWPDLEALFESRGGPHNCWCMVWRATGPETRDTTKAGRKAMLRQRVWDGTPIGLLGYLNGEPVAWCSVAPRETFTRLGGASKPAEDPHQVWSVVCFFVTRQSRGSGIFHKLLDAAQTEAKKHGATVLEAYPVDPEAPSYRFMGFVPAFEEAGFEHCGMAGTRRHVMRKPL